MNTVHKPFLPSDTRRPSGRLLTRAATAFLMGQVGDERVKDLIARNWPHDKDVELLVRAAVSPNSMTTTTALVETALADFIVSLGPQSAGAQLLARGLQLSFDGKGAFIVPGLISDAANTSFVSEGNPIPVRQFSISGGPTLSPKKFATIAVFLREIFQHSTPNIERLVSAVLTESVGLALSSAVLDTAAADASRPAGLRNGIAATTASIYTDVAEAANQDVSTLAAAVSAVSGDGQIIFVASPRQAFALKTHVRSPFPFEILTASSLPAGTVMAVAAKALVSAIDATPRFDVSTEATPHMDTSPLPIGSVGTPPTVAAPTLSLWQTGAVGLRMIMEVSWGLRSSAGVSWMQNVLW
jgi:hypothetical protein